MIKTFCANKTQGDVYIHRLLRSGMFIGFYLVLTSTILAQYQMENTNRGLVAIRTSSTQVYIGWKMFGTEPASVGFNVYRGTTKLNASPITNSTNYVDNINTDGTYTIKSVINGVEQAASEAVGVWSQQYLEIPLQIPAGGTTPSGESYTYTANDCSVGDLDGDGQYEIVVKWDPTNAKDNSQAGYTGNAILDAYRFNGTRLWRIDLGINIRSGAHYTQFLVYDLDGDGRAEVACKTADGTRDGQGSVIGSATADYRNTSGYVLTGPEFLTIFEGTTGRALATANYIVPRGTVSSWGDSYGNRVDRFVSAVAYLDGQRPSLVMGRGYYTRMVRAAWDWRNGQLTNRWTFDNNATYSGQGNHQMTVGDSDGDGKQEIFNGSSAINDNGSGFWVNGKGHGDALHMSDMNPDRAGLEIWMPYESPSSSGNLGAALLDAATGAILWSLPGTTDIGRANAADIDPNHKGYEVWAAGATGGLFNIQGTQLTTSKPSINFSVWWDGDLQRELLDNVTISKWNPATSSASAILSPAGVASNNSTKATPALTADLFGDWREEVIWRTSDNSALRIYTTTITTATRIYTLMHDPQYRTAVAWQNSAYNQPPHPGFYIGGGMSTPPLPNIVLVGGSAPTGGTIQENTTGFCSVDGTIDSNNAGYTGSGFANSTNAAGAGVNWRVTASAGTYTLTWRYSNGGGSDRPGRVLVDGASVVSSLSFPASTDWTTWTTVSATVTLSAGTHTLRLEATGSGGLANIDNISVTGPSVQPAACTAATASDYGESSQDPATEDALLAIPNPVNDNTVEVRTTLKTQSPVTISVVDLLTGKEVYTEDLGTHNAGDFHYKVSVTATGKGPYVVRLKTNTGIRSVKVLRK